ncbi:MAG TPA: tRNA pseudouridine(38-40) synthase TruA [Spirochaetia bacterium]|nr:tRNA pseudouridine(38-40) synthase TruA [Spirochaetia bacterium]
MAERNIRLTLAYDGTDFEGWQVQNRGRTVQGVIEEGLQRMHGHPVRVLAAGRTDSGVHATGQVASFRSDIASIPGSRFRDAVNAYLPHDVRVLSSAEVEWTFHARRSARQRVYRYYTVCGPVLLPHLRHYRHWMRRSPDLVRLNSMAAVLVGQHDFTCFSAEGDANHSKVRRVDVSAFHREGETLVYTIAATSFLWKMVRTIMGTLFSLEEQAMGARELRLVMEARSRANAGATAPARGLFLERVIYGSGSDDAQEPVEEAEPAGGLAGDGLFPAET